VLKAARTVQAKAKRRSLREASGVAGWGSNPYVSDDEDSLEEEDGEVPYFSVVDFDEEVRKFASLQVQPPLRRSPVVKVANRERTLHSIQWNWGSPPTRSHSKQIKRQHHRALASIILPTRGD
jgi:hypothetical protein